jgi:23S rRNA pseudouridine2605 synthase
LNKTMSTENEEWRNNSSNGERVGAGRDGNRSYNREGGYSRSYNREASSDRPYRPRFNPNSNSDERRSYGERPQRSSYNRGGDNGGRPQRPRFNANGYGEERRSYGDRPQRSYNRADGEQRPYRPRYNSNNDGEERQYRPSYNNREGGNSYGNREGGNSYGNRQQRPYRQNGGNGYGNNRPQQRRNNGNYDPNAKYSKKKQIEYKEQFVDPNEPIRLNKFLANAGVCSRREADEFITAGVVSVNGEVVSELGTKIKRGDVVKFHDQTVSIERKIYVLLNKPKDCVTTSDDPQSRKTVMDLVKGACTERIYPVGRLDRNTTGVLLLTNDGDLASKLTHPKYLKKKIYHVYLDKNLTKADMEQIAAGIQLEDGEIHADVIDYANEKKDQVGIEIHSGKNRIVRRIFESLGYKVVKLDRVFFAGLTKKGLKRGDWRYLTEQEVNFLRMGSFE